MPSTTSKPLSVRDLTFTVEGAAVLVACRQTDTYARFPPDGAALLRRLQEGYSPGAATDWYWATFGEPVDIDDFLQTLGGLGFLDDLTFAVDRAPTSTAGAALGRVLFSRPAAAAFVIVMIAGGFLLIRSPGLFPTYRSLFFSPYLAVDYLVLLAVQIPLCLVHEWGHALAARRRGVPTRTTLGRRFLFVVFETRADGLVTLTRRCRILPILAGTLVDLLAFVGLIALARLDGEPGSPGLFGRVCLAVALATLLRIVWQFYFFLRTDVYYLLSTVLGTDDLRGAATWTLRCWARRLSPGHTAQSGGPAPPPHDLRHARWYAPVVLLGYALVLVNLATVGAPAVTHLLWLCCQRWAHPAAAGPARLLDSTALILLTLAQFATPAMLLRRERASRISPTKDDAA